ncbi:hypothetical protein VKT23_007591 [Stygiomarasmius scandens]|uniref:Uncharacterized protein n=1 Tax=Marasmiellus scandens TaxID=2682957 RepID=A0ABR1JMT5_9AGAR
MTGTSFVASVISKDQNFLLTKTILKTTNGRIYVRREYETLYTRLCDVGCVDVLKTQGVVVTGSPGIEGVTLLFDGSGVYQQLEKDLKTSCVPNATPPVWSLIDSNVGLQPPAPAVRAAFLFVVLTTPPNPARYDRWSRQGLGALLWIMNTWSNDELSAGFKLATVSINSEHTADFGPCPRDHYLYSQNPQRYQTDIDLAIQDLRSAEAITHLLDDANPRCDGRAVSHHIFYLERLPGDSSQPLTSDDKIRYEVKSRAILERLIQRVPYLDFQSSLHVMRMCTDVPENSILAGWIFESLAVAFTSGNAKGYSSAISRFSPMKMTEMDKSFKWVEFEPESGSLPDKLPILHREIVHYENLDTISLDQHYYYILADRRNSFFDAFFFDIDDSNAVTVWVLQMTKSVNKRAKTEKGFPILSNIREIVLPNKQVTFKYVLVSPNTRIGPAVWFIPKSSEWSSVEGNLCVQYVDVGSQQARQLKTMTLPRGYESMNIDSEPDIDMKSDFGKKYNT